MLEEGVPLRALLDLTYIAKTPYEFFVGMKAAVQLTEIVNETYGWQRAYQFREDPDDGDYDEYIEAHS